MIIIQTQTSAVALDGEVDNHDWGALKPSYISQSQRDSSKVFGNAESSKANVRISQPGETARADPIDVDCPT